MNIVVAEPLSPAGLALLKEQPGWNVIVADPKTYAQHLGIADALLVRSAVKVNQEVLAQAPFLKVIGRAGVGVDNVDVKAATAAGVLVMNTPGGNAVSVAEHTIGLMLAMARSIPQASASTKAGKWEKKKFMGNELRGKTLGIVGLGSIGREVVRRARAFEMRIVASDPFVNSVTASELGVRLVSLDELYTSSDYITLHVALTVETQGMINDTSIAKMKDHVRIVNCARGELIDGEALRRGIESGKIAGASLDVFQTEPPAAGEPLLALDSVLATPHIGGSTEEAQEIVGVKIAEQVVGYLTQGIALNAVNVPAMTADQYKTVGPYATLAEQLGRFAAYVAQGNPKLVRLVYRGRIAEENTILIRNAGLAGVLSRGMERKANVVNAVQFASDRGLVFSERHEKRSLHTDSVQLELETDSGTTIIEGAVVLDRPRLLRVDGVQCEGQLGVHMLYLKVDDLPGVVGHVGSVLGQNGVNIANFSLGRDAGSTPSQMVALIETDTSVTEPILQKLLSNPVVRKARIVEVGG